MTRSRLKRSTTSALAGRGKYDGGTRMEVRSVFDSREQMEQLVNMGMTEDLQQAVGQMDALLAD
jgi:hypothetical protein